MLFMLLTVTLQVHCMESSLMIYNKNVSSVQSYSRSLGLNEIFFLADKIQTRRLLFIHGCGGVLIMSSVETVLEI